MERRDALKKAAMISGSAVLTPSLLTLLQSCQQQDPLDWQPKFLNEAQARLVTALVDTILPKTDTPGALDMNVHIFIDLVYSKIYDKAGQKLIASQLNAFDQNCKDKYGGTFVELDDSGRSSVLTEAEANSGKFNGKVWGTAVGEQKPVGFYRSFKSLALWAYFSSEEIGKNVLSYDPIPGEYLGCIPLSEVGNTWSL
ncbi:MAG: gluconate 2-dehydrogenase subunit 3 family protein [Cyclobacteriaceae bacterium]